MSPIDLLPRTLARPVDTSALRDTSAGSETGDGSGAPSEAEGFETLLEGLTEQSQGKDGKTRSSEVSDAILLPETSGPADASTDVAGSVFALLEGFLPQALPQTGSMTSEDQGPVPANSSLLTLQDLQQLQEGPDPVKSPLPPRMLVAVQHQETHFRPVTDHSAAELSAEGNQATENAPGASASTPKGTPSSVPLHVAQHRPGDVAAKNQSSSLVVPSTPTEENSTGEEKISPPHQEKVENLKSGSDQTARGEPQGLLPSTLQRIAHTLGTEARAMTAEASLRSLPSNGMSRNISIKTSDAALRVLNLQLHPAELGTVTVKMKLAGDALEMELHVEKEETAQLLKHDSEKLSSLLRGSGYRPDVISIQVSDGTSQDRTSPSRSQADMQFQGQSFPQGGGSQDDSSRNREKSYASARAEHHKSAADDHTMGSHDRGGVYL